MSADVSSEEKRILIGAREGSNAAGATDVLTEEGYATLLCGDAAGLIQRLDQGVGVVIIDDAFVAALLELSPASRATPAWTNIPVILITQRQCMSRADFAALRAQLPASIADLVVLESPLGEASLLSTVAAVWRSRQRQVEIRDRLNELAEQRATFESLVEHLPVGVCLIDMNGATILSNPTYERYVPNRQIPSADDARAGRWLCVDSDGQPLPRDQFAGARALRGERVSSLDARYFPEEGGELWARISAVPLYDANQTVKGAALVIIDIDAQKQNEDMLRRFNDDLEAQVKARTRALEDALEKLTLETQERARAEEQLRQSMKMDAVGQLTGGIAHDFNNMLTGVIGTLDLMRLRIGRQQYGDLDRYMSAAHSSASRAAALTQRLLAFSRRQPLESRVVAVNPLILSLGELLQRTLTERIILDIQLDEASGLAEVDPNQLENALLNLSINARDAMPDGGTLTITTRLARIDAAEAADLGGNAGTYVAIDIADTGVGIPAAMLTKIFEPFFTTKPLGQGTGLGLSMVYGFVKQSSGFISVSSTENAGTSITLYLPAAQASTQVAEARAANTEVRSGTGQAILVVEDDDSVRLLLDSVLQDLGYRVHLAENGQQALDMLPRIGTLDLLVTDVGLPGLNGRQLAEIVQQRRPGLPVLFISGYAENAATRSEFLGPRMRLMTKPFTLECLAETVSSVLQI